MMSLWKYGAGQGGNKGKAREKAVAPQQIRLLLFREGLVQYPRPFAAMPLSTVWLFPAPLLPLSPALAPVPNTNNPLLPGCPPLQLDTYANVYKKLTGKDVVFHLDKPTE